MFETTKQKVQVRKVASTGKAGDQRKMIQLLIEYYSAPLHLIREFGVM
jgi:hypothetical protein